MASPAHLEKLLVCTDESPDSQGAVTAALDLAKAAGCQVFLLQVLSFIPLYELQAPDLLPPPMVNLELQAAQEAAVRSRLESWQEKAAEMGVRLEPRLRTSASAYEGILEEAEAVQPDWIIMGRHGLTGLRPAAPGQRYRPGHRPQCRQRPGGAPGCGPGIQTGPHRGRRLALQRRGLAGGPEHYPEDGEPLDGHCRGRQRRRGQGRQPGGATDGG